MITNIITVVLIIYIARNYVLTNAGLHIDLFNSFYRRISDIKSLKLYLPEHLYKKTSSDTVLNLSSYEFSSWR